MTSVEKIAKKRQEGLIELLATAYELKTAVEGRLLYENDPFEEKKLNTKKAKLQGQITNWEDELAKLDNGKQPAIHPRTASGKHKNNVEELNDQQLDDEQIGILEGRFNKLKVEVDGPPRVKILFWVLALIVFILIVVVIWWTISGFKSSNTPEPSNTVTTTTPITMSPAPITTPVLTTTIPASTVALTNTPIVTPSPSATATATATLGPQLVILHVGTSRRGDTIIAEPGDVATEFTQGQDVYAYIHCDKARPNIDSVGLTVIFNDTSKPATSHTLSHTLTKESGFSFIPLGKLAEGNYKLEVRYNGNLVANQPEFKVLSLPTPTPLPPLPEGNSKIIGIPTNTPRLPITTAIPTKTCPPGGC
jgi:hypothetical protein